MTTPGPYVPEPHRKTDQQNTPVEPSDNGEPQFSKESIDNERDPFGRNEEIPGDSAKEKPLRPMPSWIEYGNRDIDRSQYHVGEGFLEIGGFVMLIGQSYVGKSTLLAQISVNVAIGRTWLFFKVDRPLRLLTVQAEDPENKLIKMGWMSKRMELTEEQIKLANENTAVLTIRDLQDKGAIDEIERHASAFKADILCINPMTSYLGGSVYKDEVINKFLRVELTPMLDRLKMSAIVVHHPPKPIISDKEPKDLTAFELQYGGAGMAALTNAPRDNIFLVHVHDDVFKLIVGKGFEDLGTKEIVAFLRRSKNESDIMLWERCESEKAEEATVKEIQRKSKKDPKKSIKYESLLALFKPTVKISYESILERSPKSRDWTVNALKELVREKKLIRSSPEHNPKGARAIFFHLPTLLEPATGDWDQQSES